MRNVDLRSDTVTLPTQAMRQAMYQAEVGDDVYGEDPTVQKLENLGAQLMGKEAGLLVVSGTMGNQVSILAHTNRGDELICEAESHIFYYEVAGMAVMAGVQARQVTGCRGILSAEAIRQVIRPRDIHQPSSRLICLENSHNRAGGTCYTQSQLRDIQGVAAQNGIRVHMDGARIFNAAAAQKTSVGEIARYVDTVQFCLSKGLGAPIGSLVVGSRDFIDKARRYRKMLGGGMRQAGIIAAAGIVALTTMTDRLAEDHAHARTLAEALANQGYAIDLAAVETNIVIFERQGDVPAFIAQLGQHGIKANQFGEHKVRMVTHYGVSRDDIDYTVSILAKLAKG